ncbi:glycosyltransferase family 2 protein [Pseudonocardia asaccharolytica]|uniref:N-acetylglucosaminyl-diphospho-decaprenol L-rhamnosyltransferase n=1 Tax=Pseudonocardia asaccharolytica DSM 44247 = NBRC 16224 TaxID=1123024 RepID=A0A511CWW4_9PSEU|nr:glycosyltransferase family 2 protein [Pseudonocardia asaccharolytica]GEL16967.1 N-acetylglucosaminyl-diphospho-decaprenol L-rhamnosyltransferase [Pseudonocardia asaccharolytica DSM 44247 = NBRC 16224]
MEPDPACDGEELAVITVSRSADDPVERLRASAARATGRRFRFLVANSGSPRATADMLTIGEDIGYPGAVNRAVAGLDARVGWIAVAEPDVVWGEGALDALLAAGLRWPRAGALGPRPTDPGGAPLPGRWIADALLARAWSVGACPDPCGDEGAVEGPTGLLPGGCLLLRRTAFDSVDGFDARYPAPLADRDLADRLCRAGWLTVVVPGASAVRTGTGPAGCAMPLDEQHRLARRYLSERHRGLRRAPLRAVFATLLAARAAALRRTSTCESESEGTCWTTSKRWCSSGERAPGCGR